MTKKRLIIIITVISLIIIGLVVWMLSPILFGNKSEISETDQSSSVTKTNIEEKRAKAEEIAMTEGGAASITYLQTEVNNATDDTEKADLLGVLAIYTAADGLPESLQKSLEYFLESYKLNPTEDTAAVIAATYRRMGNTAEAIRYYEFAIEAVKRDGSQFAEEEGTGYEIYEQEIETLRAQ